LHRCQDPVAAADQGCDDADAEHRRRGRISEHPRATTSGRRPGSLLHDWEAPDDPVAAQSTLNPSGPFEIATLGVYVLVTEAKTLTKLAV